VKPTGRLPHAFYLAIRSHFERIVQLREDLRKPDTPAAKQVGLRGRTEFARAYDIIKANEEAIIVHGDWTGVEREVYKLHPDYEQSRTFQKLLAGVGDPRTKKHPRGKDAPDAEPHSGVPPKTPDTAILPAGPRHPQKTDPLLVQLGKQPLFEEAARAGGRQPAEPRTP